MEKIKVTRKTTESEMNVVLDFAPLKKDYRKYIKTPIPFLNHMIEHIAWRGEVNIDVDLKLDEFVLTHVICEDLGIALGEKVEGMDTEDLETFLEGFAQGAMCTLHIDLVKGHNGHHIWEAIYRSFGSALNKVFEVSESRKGKTSGVAGKIDWVIE